MKYKVELIFIDEESDKKDVSYFTYVEAPNVEAAIAAAKSKQEFERPDLSSINRWASNAFPTNEES